jgi:hypothetical protein
MDFSCRAMWMEVSFPLAVHRRLQQLLEGQRSQSLGRFRAMVSRKLMEAFPNKPLTKNG